MQSQSGQSDSEQQPKNKRVEQDEIEFVVPDSKDNLRACLECGLIKSKKQWEKDRECQNCGTFMRIDSSKNTTPKFSGLIALIHPKKSFMKKKLQIFPKHGRKLKAAAYGF